ncbi:PP2C family protein-serine/threonine phosphatase [Aquabacterium sp.]|uniref:PP2C family protein-serine/threonine phosphatase n=1 Tax=Aquabacterium sp. TaxID=1872578 RepID=UPI002C79DEE2|nr:SpoIIE family protein phosphatase [Aquabacterium sp.]HSW04101.1 SpoIIE family protein phosphatase [Aquabacterium sp.]
MAPTPERHADIRVSHGVTICGVNFNDLDRNSEATGDQTIVRKSAPRAAMVAPEDWVHTLVIVEGIDPGRRIKVEARPLVLGRKPQCDLVLAEADVSGQHCEVRSLAGQDALQVIDLNSTNGSFIDGQAVRGPALLTPGALLQIGRQVLRHELQPRQVAEAALEFDRDLDKASGYVQALLPPPLRSAALRADWVFKPSTRLGGDGFGYVALDEHRLAAYVIDVAGHGAGAAMHCVSVLNVLRQRALPHTDFTDPAQVLSRLNETFPMDNHGGLFFTIWYGVYDAARRVLDFAAAGHHPAYLRSADGTRLQPLHTRNPIVGGVPPDHHFLAAQVAVEPGSSLYAFSDGVFEIMTAEGRQWRLADFLPLIHEAPADRTGEPERLLRRVLACARPGPLDDDFSLLLVTFLS